ncbi:helix-turn-helix transcriptional regulator [Nocardiopsis synnemataformans]|uniref:helix-turn-helix transcriptional regulator n=1 Tax=Nocardiopsis synnemataformans TaxID=61305 RepID=UPI003EBBC342
MQPRLVDTEAAELYTGRPRTTLYRWAHEGRVTKYGTRGKGRALWNLNELPACPEGGTPPPPPPLPARELTSA